MDLAALGSAPISDASPTGEDCRYDESYQALQLLVNPNPNTPLPEKRWDEVLEKSENLLSTVSKDLTVATYITYGLLNKEGLSGFADGLHLMQSMMTTYWDDMFPPARRMRGRKNAINWVYEKLQSYLEEYSGPPQPGELVEEIKTTLSAIDEFTTEKMGDDAPYARPTIEAMGRVPLQPVAPPPPDPNAPAPTTPAAGTAPSANTTTTSAQAPASGGQIDSPAAARRILGDCWTAIRETATWLRNNDTPNPMAYRLVRMSAWADVDQAPPATNGATMIPPPDDQVVSVLNNLYEAGNWPDLLDAAESNIQRYLFWLDLHRYSYEALDNMGGKHMMARDAVGQETGHFVARVSGIDKLSFNDGPPFADMATRDWLQQVAPGEAGGGGGGSAIAEDEDFKEVFDQAKSLYKEKKIPQAVQLLDARRRNAGSGKAKYLWRLALCRLLEGGRTASGIVDPHLDKLVQDIEDFQLDAWDPALAVEGLSLAYKQWASRKEDKWTERAESVLNHIASLDTGAALGLQV